MAEIRSNIQRLQAKFEELKKAVIKSLNSKGIAVTHFVRELTLLPASNVAEHENYFPEDVKELGKCVKYRPLFSCLNPHWNYISPHLLYHLIRKFLKAFKEMMAYNRELRQFRSQTSLRMFVQIEQTHTQLPEGFSCILVHMKSDILKDMTLENVENFRKKYMKHHNLCDYTLMLVSNATMLPSAATFSVPKSVTEGLKHNIPIKLLEEFGVIYFEIAGTQVYSDSSVDISQLLKVPPSASDAPQSPGKYLKLSSVTSLA